MLAKKILIFSTSYIPRIGGAELAIKHITDRLPNYEFHLITSRYDSSLPAEEIIGNVRVFRVGGRWSLAYFFLPKLFFPLVAFRWALKFDKQFGPYDLTFSLQASQAGGAAWLFKLFRPKIPLLLNLQEGQDLGRQSILKRFFRRRIIRSADHVTAISAYLKTIALQQGASEKAISIIPNSADDAFFKVTKSTPGSEALKQKLGIIAGDRVIISISRLVSKNGLDILLRALPSAKIPSLKVLLVGSGGQEQELRALVRDLGIQRHVLFAGSVPNEQLPAYLAIADVFIRPSRSEGLGISFLEAMAAGVPVIGTPVGGIPDFLKDGETGLLCQSNDPTSLARAIDRLFGDERLRTSIVERARALMEKDYRWKSIAQNYDRIFQELL